MSTNFLIYFYYTILILIIRLFIIFCSKTRGYSGYYRIDTSYVNQWGTRKYNVSVMLDILAVNILLYAFCVNPYFRIY